jgi:FKBP-type peptidyl-prolyl cis-trans isomerase FkpA/FKBP-type peptidyl-prolyl cis-trans isomerase FklB
MRKVLSWPLAILCLTVAVAWAASPDVTTDEQKTLYALGLALSQSLSNFGLSEAELELVKAGLTDGVLQRDRKVDLQAFMPKVQELQRTRLAAVAEKEKQAGEAFLSKAAAAQGATKTESGMVITPLTPGKGASPAADDTVKVHYHGTLIDGTVFDSSVQRGEPATFQLNKVIKCWTEGVQRMQVGGKSRLVCPPQIAYGDRGAPPRIKPGATIVFEVELLDVVK